MSEKIRVWKSEDAAGHRWQAVCPECGRLRASYRWTRSMARAVRHLREWHGVRF